MGQAARRPATILALLGVVALAAVSLSVGSSGAAGAGTSAATVTGYVLVCGGPAPGGCWIEPLGGCEAPTGCQTSDRVAAVAADGRRVAIAELHRARFRLTLAPGQNTLELLADGKHVHGLVIQRKLVRLRAHHATHVQFRFDVP